MRYELKMVFPQGEQGNIQRNLLSSPCMIQEIYQKRQINNVYFDTLNYSDYLDTCRGAAYRKKFRMRWYGDLFQDAHPNLEMKFKRGWEGGKISFPFPHFSLEGNSMNAYFSLLLANFSAYYPDEQEVLGEFLGRNPVLVNSYQRQYFQTADGDFRFTLDDAMFFYDYGTCVASRYALPCSQDPKVVLELKFQSDQADRATLLLNQLGYRLSKNSKYVNGIDSVFFHKHPMPF